MGSSQVVADRLIDPWSRSGRLDPGAVRMARTPSSAPPSGNGDDVLLVERENVHESFLGKENLNSRTRTEKTSGHRFWLEKRLRGQLENTKSIRVHWIRGRKDSARPNEGILKSRFK